VPLAGASVVEVTRLARLAEGAVVDSVSALRFVGLVSAVSGADDDDDDAAVSLVVVVLVAASLVLEVDVELVEVLLEVDVVEVSSVEPSFLACFLAFFCLLCCRSSSSSLALSTTYSSLSGLS